ncbi:hypothetical protein [Halohasta salina]|uniref:hypothetical protein n=1 Tax=Halohasta salina TaxID=2961621 RepID=UPI0020A55B2C|nr:hypothetical protein [Halohasta salina]
MPIPPPPVDDSRLADWRQTDRTIEAPFSTPIVSVETHTVVYEERTQRERIREATGLDHPWRFFFSSRVRLDPPQPPNPMLSSLLRSRVFSAFVDRLADRGLTDITDQERGRLRIAGSAGVRKRYRARLRVDPAAETGDPLVVPVEALVAVWADDDYLVAGGAYPAGSPEAGPDGLVAELRDEVDPTADREELVALINGCGDQ